jgi:flagellar basal-body rod protein FlgF
VSPDGLLVNRDGLPVLSDHGAIVIPPGETVRITPEGEILGEETGPIATLARFDGMLEHAGGNLWRSTGLLTPVDTRVASGALEGSSVDPTAAMIELVEASRAFEMLQKAMQASDEMDAKLNQTGGA